MKNTLKNIKADSFSGLIFGLESLRGGMTLLNGPTGCKFYHSAVVDGALLRSVSFDPQSYPQEFYFGQSRVPCTYLDAKDYVYGVEKKLQDLLEDIRDRKPDFLAVVNSPGAALIGDDLEKIASRVPGLPLTVFIPTPLYSQAFGKGLSQGLVALLEKLQPAQLPVEKNRVNLLGFSLLQNHVMGNIACLKDLLSKAGLEVGTYFFDQGLDQIKDLRRAKLNLVLSPEDGLDLAKYLKEKYAMPYWIPPKGQPVGFDATEAFFKDLARILPMNLDPVMEEIQRARGRAYIFLARYSSLLGLPKGAGYSLSGPASLLLPLQDFLKNYLGMVPGQITCSQGSYPAFEKILMEEKLASLDRVQMVFGDGNDLAQAMAQDKRVRGLEIQGPTMGYLDVLEKTLYGPQGALYILEKVLNGLKMGDEGYGD